MRKLKRIIPMAILILVVVVGGLGFYQSRAASRTSTAASGVYTQVVDVRKGNLSAAISMVGELDAIQNADLSFIHMKGTTKLAELKVAAGNTVEAGQVLATIDAASYQQALDQARSDLQAAEATLTDLQTPPTELAIAQADLAIAKAEVQLQQAQSDLSDIVNPDIPTLQAAVADAQSALAQAQSSQLEQESTNTFQATIQKMLDQEGPLAKEYYRLAGENYSDPYYQDRLELAYNKMMDVQDPRMRAEIQRQIDALKAQMDIRKNQTALADAQEALAEAQAGGDPLALAKARLAVREAEVALAQARSDRADLDEGADAVKLASAQADVDKKRLAVTDAGIALAGAELVAPFAGTILQTDARVGDLIKSDTTILTIASLKALQVIASVDETMIRQVATGQKAQITFDAFPGQSFNGEVQSVPLQGTLQGDVMVYEVPVSLNGAEKLPLLVGMTANVQIQIGQVTDALLVPAMALQRVGGMVQVMVPSADPQGAPDAVPVEVGLNDGTNAQIVRGLNEGDKVVVQMQSSQSNQFNFRGGFGMGAMMGGGPRQRD